MSGHGQILVESFVGACLPRDRLGALSLSNGQAIKPPGVGISPARRLLQGASVAGIMAFSACLATAAPPKLDQPWENSLGMKFAPVPGTSTLFSIWETRVQDFEAFVQATKHDAT